MPGERVLIARARRAIAGLWRWGCGSIEIKRDAKTFLLPQRPNVPLGTLRRAASYPEAPESVHHDAVAAAFRRVLTSIPREHRATIVVSAPGLFPSSALEVGRMVADAGYRARLLRQETRDDGEQVSLTFEVRLRQVEKDGLP
jgi:hypothetical protein